jgi:hypothetical protein
MKAGESGGENIGWRMWRCLGEESLKKEISAKTENSAWRIAQRSAAHRRALLRCWRRALRAYAPRRKLKENYNQASEIVKKKIDEEENEMKQKRKAQRKWRKCRRPESEISSKAINIGSRHVNIMAA